MRLPIGVLSLVLLLGGCAFGSGQDGKLTLDDVRTARKYAELVVTGAVQGAEFAEAAGWLPDELAPIIAKVKDEAPIAFAAADKIIAGADAGTPEAAMTALEGVIADALLASAKLRSP